MKSYLKIENQALCTQPVVERKKMKANEIFEFLIELKQRGVDLSKVDVTYKADNISSDVVSIESVEEDLYDTETNNILESIVFITDNSEE